MNFIGYVYPHIGYFLSAAFLWSLTMEDAKARALAASASVAAVLVWAFPILRSPTGMESRALVGPLIFLAMSAIFISGFYKSLGRSAKSFAAKTDEMTGRLAVEKEQLAVATTRALNRQRALDKTTAAFAAAKETLSRMKKEELCENITRLISSVEGVSGVWVFDDKGACLCADPRPPSESRSAAARIFLETGAAPEGDCFFGGISDGNRRLGALLAEFVSAPPASDNISAVENLFSVFALGCRRAALFEEYESKSRHDALTGLFNRRYFFRKLDIEIKRAHRYGSGFALLMLDADHFKRVNDTYGHPAGDEVLVKISYALKAFEYPGAFVGRYGGEEFVVCLPYCDSSTALEQAERVRRLIEAADFSDNLRGMIQFRVTVSVGAAVYPDSGVTIDALAVAADNALYAAKENGRNRSVLSATMPAAGITR
ncbi:MAG: GGDEF domain-containing protein [Endomicrobiia bacterium]|nr:GGDEF domain-containing protein [Endomicrobiia bacterium]